MFGANPAILGGLVTPVTPLLDTLTNTPMGAWAMDLERAAYAGPCLRVRNATTNVETDIGFSGGVLNNSAMAIALGTDGGTATIWYNQVAGGPNLVPPGSSLLEQPTIPSPSAGTYYSAVSFASLISTMRPFKVALTPGSTTKWMLTFVVEMNGDTTYGVLASYDAGSGDSSTGGSRMVHGNGTQSVADQAGAEGYKSGVATGYHTITNYTDGANIGVYVDGVAGVSAACTTPIGASGQLFIGCAALNVQPWLGGIIKAMVFWNTYSNSDRLLAEAWFRSRYGTP